MSYRFLLGSMRVECDTVEELFACADRPDAYVLPATPQRRTRRVINAASQAKAKGASHSWALAKAYAAKYKLPIVQARGLLAADTQKRAIAEALLVG
jgi:hypothetical protein